MTVFTVLVVGDLLVQVCKTMKPELSRSFLIIHDLYHEQSGETS